MQLRRARKPNVGRLRRKRRIDGLREALRYREVARDDDGVEWDVGVIVRVEAAEALRDFDGADVAGDLAAALKDPEPAVRVAAVYSLRSVSGPTAVQPLVDCVIGIPDRHEEVAASAGELLIDWQVDGAPEILLERLFSPEAPALDEHHHESLECLLAVDPRGPSARRAIADRVVLALRNPDGPAIEARAEAILGWLGPGVADRVLGPLSNDATPALVRAAGLLGDARIVEPVIANLGSDDAEMRRAAASAAGALNHTRAVPALLSATQDPEQSVRDAASAALNRMGMAAVIAGLAEIVHGDGAAQVLPYVDEPREVEPGNGEPVLPAQLLEQTRIARTAAARQSPPATQFTQAPAAAGSVPHRARRGGLVDRLLGRTR